MSSLLKQLQKKPIPKKLEVVNIYIVDRSSKQEVDRAKTELDILRESEDQSLYEEAKKKTELMEKKIAKIPLVDKTSTGFDREALLKKLRHHILVAPELKISIPHPSTKLADDVSPLIPPKKSKKRVFKKIGKKIKLTLSKDVTKGTITGTTLERPPKRRTKKVKKTVILEAPVEMFVMGDTIVKNRVKADTLSPILAPAYYMNNREIFINFINSLFMPYRDELLEESSKLSCKERFGGEFSLLTHQKIVRDYLNLYTPYRGLLLYHGLGSGKTCSSIAIAEGMKTAKQIAILTPASLRMNYIEQLKFCGDSIFKKNQFWEFMNTKEHPDYIDVLSQILSLDRDYIINQEGAWMVNTTKTSNFNDLDAEEKQSLDNQLNEMMRAKYTFFNYNGLRDSHLTTMTRKGTINPFDNKVVIIDEAHNFISRIVNKMKEGKSSSLSMKLYEYLMSAKNARIVMLTGTPIINYPNEIAIMFNILRGYIQTYSIHLDIPMSRKINKEYFEKLFSKFLTQDYIDYTSSNTTLTITRNPFGYINKWKGREKDRIYKGVALNERGQIDDEIFIRHVLSTLQKNDFKYTMLPVQTFKALPDNSDKFRELFFQSDDKNKLTNLNMFKRRILGLTSYFRDIEELMPRYNEDIDFHEIKINMSNDQFAIYEKARQAERKQELSARTRAKKRPQQNKQKNIYDEDATSTYRIFSRLFCNYVFPAAIPRPMPKEDEDIDETLKHTNEDILDAAKVKDRLSNVDGEYTMDDAEALKKEEKEETDTTYDKRIQTALHELAEGGDEYLSPEGLKIYSPKYLHILDNIQDVDYKGLHLIYSQFRTMEGIGIFRLVLLQNGFAEFKIRKVHDKWSIAIPEADKGKPTFALYTGTETAEEKDIIRNIFNGTWDYVPASIKTELKRASSNNNYGEIIKVLMITAAGAEGMNLKNVRYVHLMEPYWHPVRLEQVVGRARRICSHENLLEKERNIEVFLYLMTLSTSQKTSDASIELRLKDQSKLRSGVPVTSDEALYEISLIKRNINKQILTAIKESAIDCVIHNTIKSKESLKCFTFGDIGPRKMAYQPNYATEERDDIRSQLNVKTVEWKAKSFTYRGKKYALQLKPNGKPTDEVYDYESFALAMKVPGINPTHVARLIRTGKKYQLIFDVEQGFTPGE